MSIGRFDFNLNIVKGSLYAIGGTGGPNENQPNVSLATVECYHPAINEWSSVADMNRRRCQAASAVHNSRIYVFGGCDNENELIGNLATDTVECYNVDKNEWTMVRIDLFLALFFILFIAFICWYFFVQHVNF